MVRQQSIERGLHTRQLRGRMLPQVAAVAEHLGSAIFLTGQPFGQVPDQPGQFVDERRLGNRTASSKRACTRWHSARYRAGSNSRR